MSRVLLSLQSTNRRPATNRVQVYATYHQLLADDNAEHASVVLDLQARAVGAVLLQAAAQLLPRLHAHLCTTPLRG